MKKQNSLFARKPAKSPKSKASMDYPETLEIIGLSHEARGIAKHNGKTIFVTGALTGETVRYEISKKHRRFDEAECVEVITPSPNRVEPFCQYYGQCGGCDLQHLEHSEQIKAKESLVLDQLQRLGKFNPESTTPPLSGSDQEYRRSCRIGINQLMRDGTPIIGFRRRGSSKLLQVDNCPILINPINKILGKLKAVLSEADSCKEITHAELSMGDQQGAMTLRIKKPLPESLSSSLQKLAEDNEFRLYFDNGQQINAFGDEADLSYQLEKSETQIGFKPGDFIQVNASVNTQMINRAMDWLDLKDNDRVLDLFSGVGNFSLPLATKAGSVIGVEGVEDMVQRAQNNAKQAGLNNCEFYRADLSKDLKALPWYKQGFSKILIDPPRTGALEVIKQLEQHQCDQILYVSCNPSALARDGAELIRQGYKASKFCVMDMFPHTSHVESLVLFEK
ncbi:23S rRNA (uracil(1939)-C(5))-methyltransferase RlmD [Neptuniibacter caesariensis]|uniref:23S rRNA (uracil(1939)-C(5))-methyltransferase RlmD n=1 Tax=Neptuniibacter caesariensis TaxID=207954 RepID=A0A7U8C1Q1_NEPCE|nr:23S rRNA (uracil(1939)-C(5))-methyltransferase RlmD [Neptuniibacter caesariensis]EAR59883.1 23S rRNA (uracil-5-)-methyltransferase [Oceanospirillum sp. MED92] [Neptuniibacter caesariensis]